MTNEQADKERDNRKTYDLLNNPFMTAPILDQPRLLKFHDLMPGDRVISSDGYAGTVLDTRDGADICGRAQIHWDDSEVTWIRPDMLRIIEHPATREELARMADDGGRFDDHVDTDDRDAF